MTDPQAVALLRRLTDAAQAILAADSPDHTLTPTDEQWGELDSAADEAGAFLEQIAECTYCEERAVSIIVSDGPRAPVCAEHEERGIIEAHLGYIEPIGAHEGAR